MSAWRPMGTEPRDGTHFLVFCPDDDPVVAVAFWWVDVDVQFITYADEVLQNLHPEGPEATHWLEMPELPK